MLAQHVQFKDEVMNQEQWYYADAQQQRHGPGTQSELQHLFAQGQLDLSSLIWCQGMEDWLPLQHFAMQFALQDPRGNPYADPESASARPVAPKVVPVKPKAAEPSIQQLQNYADFVGNNFETYKRKWKLATRSPNAEGTWHWPAFFFGPLWMLYRKMYGFAALWMVGLFVWTLLIVIFSAPYLVVRVTGLGIHLLAGLLANALYLIHVDQAIGEVASAHRGTPCALRAELVLRGGTSGAAVFIGGFTYLVVSSLLLLLLLSVLS